MFYRQETNMPTPVDRALQSRVGHLNSVPFFPSIMFFSWIVLTFSPLAPVLRCVCPFTALTLAAFLRPSRTQLRRHPCRIFLANQTEIQCLTCTNCLQALLDSLRSRPCGISGAENCSLPSAIRKAVRYLSFVSRYGHPSQAT